MEERTWYRLEDHPHEDTDYFMATITDTDNGVMACWWHEGRGETERVIFEDRATAIRWLESEGFSE